MRGRLPRFFLECRGKEGCEWCKQATWTLSRVVKLPRRFAQGAISVLPAVSGRTLLTCRTSQDLVRARLVVVASVSATLFSLTLFLLDSVCAHTHAHLALSVVLFLPHSIAWLLHLLWSGRGLQGTFFSLLSHRKQCTKKYDRDARCSFFFFFPLCYSRTHTRNKGETFCRLHFKVPWCGLAFLIGRWIQSQKDIPKGREVERGHSTRTGGCHGVSLKPVTITATTIAQVRHGRGRPPWTTPWKERTR